MKLPGITTKYPIELLSGLANNDSSIVPMAVKDFISNCAIVDTYKKEGGADDAREKAIEEFGTGLVWLFGIPAVKKIIDFVYKPLGLNPKFDVTLLKDKDKLKETVNSLKNSSNPALENEKNIFSTLKDKNSALKFLTNEQLYKGLSVSKFAISTAMSAFALSKLISYKQKTTQKRIEKDFKKETASKVLLSNSLNNSLSNDITFKAFDNSKNKKDITFKGISKLGELFMYNPIANTLILDGVITSSRLLKARKGEKKEVALKEIFQIAFIYAVAKPIQIMFEKMGQLIKRPIELDPKVLFLQNLKDKVKNANKYIIDNNLIEYVKDKNGAEISVLNKDFIKDIHTKDINSSSLSALIEILENNGVISIVKSKDGKNSAVSYMKNIDEKEVLKTLENINSLAKHIDKIKSIKAFKIFAVLGNVALAAWIMGVVQPKLAIQMRKMLNNGDNRNPAIIAAENEMKEKAKM